MKRSVKNFIVTTCMFLSSNLLAADDSDFEIVLGKFWNKDNIIHPLVALSHDKGFSWNYAKNTHYYCSEHYANPLVSCNKDFCIMSNSCKNQLFIALSIDQGNTWVDHEIALPTNNLYPHVRPFCNNQICVFAGNHASSTEEGNTVILGVTKNKGIIWTYPTIHNFPQVSQLRIKDLSCTDHSCVMVGQYNYQFPLAVTSTDQGETWASMKVPFSGKDASLNWVLCEGQSCIAIGEDSGNLGMGYVITSVNAGISWKKSTALFAHPYQITGATCNGNVCALVGYNNVFAPGKITKAVPFVAVSQNQGHSWFVPILPMLKEAAKFNDISCSNKHCIAIGSLNDEKAFLAISKNSGLTWSYQKDLPIPKNQLSSETKSIINYIHCSQTHCIAGGYYSDEHIMPWIIVSQDNGETWITPSTAISELPLDLTDGIFVKQS